MAERWADSSFVLVGSALLLYLALHGMYILLRGKNHGIKRVIQVDYPMYSNHAYIRTNAGWPRRSDYESATDDPKAFRQLVAYGFRVGRLDGVEFGEGFAPKPWRVSIMGPQYSFLSQENRTPDKELNDG